MTAQIKIAALGIEHRHIFGMVEHLEAEGAKFVAWWNDGVSGLQASFDKRFGAVPRAQDIDDILSDPKIDLILVAAKPSDRASLALAAMDAGKDVMSDKPGCITLDQLSALRDCVARTTRIWTVDFSERFEVPSVTVADQLVQAGEIGRVIQTVGLGPHRLNKPTRPDWFFDRKSYGGIICDLASHQIDQFLHFTGSNDAEVSMASVANYANPETPDLQDFGELALKNDCAHGYIRVDWYTPDALPTWGDGRLTILGTEGYIELRKYVDVGGARGGDHLIISNHSRCEKIDCSGAPLSYFSNLIADIRDRTQTAVSQDHTFKVMELGIKAQMLAEGVPQT